MKYENVNSIPVSPGTVLNHSVIYCRVINKQKTFLHSRIKSLKYKKAAQSIFGDHEYFLNLQTLVINESYTFVRTLNTLKQSLKSFFFVSKY